MVSEQRRNRPMIGGRDIVLGGPTEPNEARLIISLLRSKWPNLVAQDACSAVPFSDEELSGQLQVHEFFVYRDHDAFRSWTTHGATPDNSDSLVHTIIEPEAITFV